MKLSRLLEQHDQSMTTNALECNLGDPYLLKHNRIYRNIRTSCKELKFQYSLDLNGSYQALPLSQLDWILANRVVPYFDNVTVLREIEERVPSGVFWNDIMDNLKKNHVFHESCHAVARSLFKGNDRSDEQERILHFLLEESFSNTCELLAVTDAHDSIHRLFFEWNSYIYMIEDRANLKNAMSEYGSAFIFQFLMLCYLQSNFLASNLDEKSLERILRWIGEDGKSDPKKMKTLRALPRITFQLNPRFREVTTSFYLRLNGVARPFPEVLKFDFMKILESNEKYRENVLTLSAQVLI